MNLRQPWQSYRQVSTQTASPGQLVLMLFDGAIRFLDRALEGFELEDPVEFKPLTGMGRHKFYTVTRVLFNEVAG